MAYARKKFKKIGITSRAEGITSRVRPITSRVTRKIPKCVVSVACDAEKLSWDADLFAEDAAKEKMRRNSRVWGRKIRKRIVTVAFDAERFPCDADPGAHGGVRRLEPILHARLDVYARPIDA